MADIYTFLQAISSAVYGEEVRASIRDSITMINEESSTAKLAAITAKDSASASASSARQSELEAAFKASLASSSASEAKQSEINAGLSAGNALNSENAAKNSETNAASSKDAADQKASEAAESASNAASSASNAASSEESVVAMMESIQELAALTETAKTDAEAAASIAEYASNAAQESASNAFNSETSAESSKTVAETAANNAILARTAAEQARDEAHTAEGNAYSAQISAESARDAAESSAQSAQQYSGNPPMPKEGTWWIWNAETGEYENSGIGCELTGPSGIGISDISLTNGDHSPGSMDTYTIYLTDETTKEIQVYNGKNGSGVGDVLGIVFDIIIPANGWTEGSITISDNRFLASSKYRYLIDAYNDGKDVMAECGIQANDITEDGSISFTSSLIPTSPIEISIIRFEMSSNSSA